MTVAIAWLAVLPGAARADEVIEAQTVWRFDASAYTIDQGEKLEFLNADAVSPGPHDVTADDLGPDGKPLFASQTVGHGAQVPVVGAQQLRTGSYGFHCTVHPFMTATLNVSDKGAPLPPSGSPPPPAPPPSSAPPDRTPPQLRVSLAGRARRRFTARVTSDEPVKLRIRLTASVRGRTIVVGRTEAFIRDPGRRFGFSAGPTRRARRVLVRAPRARYKLTVQATDGSGNTTLFTVRRTLRR